MPLTAKGEKIEGALEREYGSKEKAEQVLYAGKNKGTFTGIDSRLDAIMAGCDSLHERLDAMVGKDCK